MNPIIKIEADGSLTLSVNLRLSGSLLSQEEQIASALNSLGNLSTQEAMTHLDSQIQAPAGYSLKSYQKKSTKRHMVK
jgi:hypothetical protein